MPSAAADPKHVDSRHEPGARGRVLADAFERVQRRTGVADLQHPRRRERLRIETEVLPVAQRYGMGTLVWAPLARDMLTGRTARTSRPTRVARP